MRSAKLIFLAIAGILWMSVQQREAQILRIAVAANMQFAAKEIAKEFNAETGIVCQVNIASSGKHYAQIVNGAKVDVFISANHTFIDSLVVKGKAKTQPIHFAGSPLILWSNTLDTKPSMNMLREDRIKKVAIANPKHAPLGKKALLCLNHETNLTIVKRKLVFAENIAQVNHLVLSKAVDVGITSRSSIMAPHTRDKGVHAHTTCGIVKQYISITAAKEREEMAVRFVDFVKNDGAKILTKHGYIVPAGK